MPVILNNIISIEANRPKRSNQNVPNPRKRLFTNTSQLKNNHSSKNVSTHLTNNGSVHDASRARGVGLEFIVGVFGICVGPPHVDSISFAICFRLLRR
mmetsp:Transcript_30770/g.62614  ORF Transcript_30770/g.62614 Transcript_30770/m.62614 type:complete len:98 (+) Transcript_30770:1411-1704(+)